MYLSALRLKKLRFGTKNGGILLCNTLLYRVQVLHLDLFISFHCPVCCLCNGADILPMMLLLFLMKANEPKSVSL